MSEYLPEVSPEVNALWKEWVTGWIERKQLIQKGFYLRDLETYVLRVHIFLEHDMISFINQRTKERVKMNRNWGFAKKLELCKMLGAFDVHDSSKLYEKFLVEINRVRNEISHTLDFKKDSLNTLRDITNQIEVLVGREPSKVGAGMFDNIIVNISSHFHFLNNYKFIIENDKLKVIPLTLFEIDNGFNILPKKNN